MKNKHNSSNIYPEVGYLKASDNLHETGKVSKDLKITDTIGNIYNRLVLIPSFINYKLKGKCFIQEFYFDTEN